MIIMISSNGDTLESRPSLRFGRAPFYIKYNLVEDTWEAHQNISAMESGGAGVAASQFLIDQQTTAALSGRFGPNAYHALLASNIRMLTFDDTFETIQVVIDGFKNNILDEVN